MGRQVAQWLSVCLWLRWWSWGPGMESCIRLPAGNLFLLYLCLCLSLCNSHEWINKTLKILKKESGHWREKVWVQIQNFLSTSVYSGQLKKISLYLNFLNQLNEDNGGIFLIGLLWWVNELAPEKCYERIWYSFIRYSKYLLIVVD